MSRKEQAAWAARDLAVTVIKAKGSATVDAGGVRVISYASGPLRIELTPAIMGTANPNQIDVWKIGDGRPVKVLAALWGDFDDIVLMFSPGPWEDALRAAAGRPRRVSDAGVLVTSSRL